MTGGEPTQPLRVVRERDVFSDGPERLARADERMAHGRQVVGASRMSLSFGVQSRVLTSPRLAVT